MGWVSFNHIETVSALSVPNLDDGKQSYETPMEEICSF